MFFSLFKIIVSFLSNPSYFRKIAATVIKVLLFHLNKTAIIKLINQRLIANKGGYIANHYGAWGSRETIPLDVMGMPKLYDVETMEFYGVEKAHEYLNSLYGDYMQLPPINKRHIHIIGMYWK